MHISHSNLVIFATLLSHWLFNVNVLADDGTHPDKDNEVLLTPPNKQVSTNPACRSEMSQICTRDRRQSTVTLSDLEALDCILNQMRDQDRQITPSCNQALWVYRKSLMEGGFIAEVDPTCSKDIKASDCYTKHVESVDKPYNLINCLIENKEKLSIALCIETITVLERVVFSDYELIERFATKCKSDILKYTCGRNEIPAKSTGSKVLPMTQGETIECLSGHIGELVDECAFEILRVAELQADDYHLDRALFFACRDDRERLCKGISSGNGRVYKCLLQNKMDKEMSTECREQLYRRQKLGWHDYKATGIVFSCKNEIKKNTCRKGASESDKHVRLSQILLCLENAAHMGQEINAECVEEMRQHRKSLLEDHRVTPELLADCEKDMRRLCSRAKSLNGRTIHCLMEHALVPDRTQRISAGCRARLEDLVKISDVSEDWRVDPVLKENCQPVVAISSCRDVDPHHIMDCLMRLLTTDVSTGVDAHAMTEDCESTLLQIQYFVARDFSLDSALYEDCAKDAEKVCGIAENWLQVEPRRGPLVLSCLYRNIDAEDGKQFKVGPKCAERVRETMRRRALSVRFIPDIENDCLEDLATFCNNKIKIGEEMTCLQDSLDQISPECKAAVINYTLVEIRDPTVDPTFWKYCRDVMETKCSGFGSNAKNDVYKSDKSEKSEEAAEDMMECLVKLKPEIKNKKCKASIDHVQLLQLKDIQFSAKFKTVCNSDVIRYCKKNSARELISCLSEIVRNDTLSESTPRISKACRKQVKYLILSKVQQENAQVDPGTIYSLCGEYVRRFCKDVSPGGGRIFECLRNNKEQITKPECFKALFRLQEDVDNDSGLDVLLKTECEAEIKEFCSINARTSQNPSQDIFMCLKLNSMKDGFNQARCGKVLRNRMVEQSSDVRLNPNLRKACALDIPKFCTDVKAGEGRIMTCLQKIFVTPGSRLTPTCQAHIEGVMQGAAQTDVRLDYPLFKFCKEEIESQCKYEKDLAGGDGGKVEECLKDLFQKNKLISGNCRVQVQLLIQSTQIDIHVDPTLNRACAIDLLLRCDGVPPGDGRLIGCLLNELEKEKSGGEARLRPQCKSVLSVRYELFQLAGSPSKMDSLEDLYSHVSVSPNRNYFLIVAMTMVGVIFIFGLFCGRATRRKAAAKDK